MAAHKFNPVHREAPLRDPRERQLAEAFGKRIVALRYKRKMSRIVVVKATGIPWKRLRRLELGLRPPRVNELVAFAMVYEVSAASLLRGLLKGKP